VSEIGGRCPRIARARPAGERLANGFRDFFGTLCAAVCDLVPFRSHNGVGGKPGTLQKVADISGFPGPLAGAQIVGHNLREMGIGDLAVPKEIKRMMEAFYGRARSYERALAADDPEVLAQALTRNVFGCGTAGGVAPLADYVRRAAGQLDAMDGAQFLRGLLAFPEPHAILADDAAMKERSRR
jgi:hypothetical protein